MSRFFSYPIRYILAVGIFYLASRPLDRPTDPTDLTSLVPWVFLVLLLLGLVAALLRYRLPHARAAEALEEAAHELKEKSLAGDEALAATRKPDPQVGEADAASGNADQGAPRPPEAFEKKRRRPLLDAWTEFHRARQSAPRSSLTAGSAISPTDHFTIARALGRDPGSLPNALPSVFTAVGLLGTFVGIAFGLAEIEPTAATEDLMEGIRTLMGGMSTAFVTSIVGITLSVWWLFEFRFAERRLKSGLDRFVVETERVFPVEEPHETLMRVAVANESVRRTAETIGNTAAEIKGNVQSLGQDLAGALEPYFEEHIAKPIRNLNTELGDRQTEALRGMVEAFQNTLASSVKQELIEFGQALRAASDHQTNAARELGTFFERLREVSETQIELLDRTTEAATVFDRGLEGLTTATEAVEAAGESASEAMVAARDAVDIARGLTEESRRQLEAQEEVSRAARRSWDAQAQLLENMRASLDRLARELGDRIVEFQTASAQKITEVFTVFDSEMAKVVDHLSGTLAELRDGDVTEELLSAVGSLREATQDLADSGQAQRDSLGKGLRAFEEGRTEFAEAARNVHRGIVAVTDGLAEAGARSEEDLQRLVDSMAAAADRIHEGGSSITASVVPLEERTAEAAERMAVLSKSIKALASVTMATRATNVEETPQVTEPRLDPDEDDGDTVPAIGPGPRTQTAPRAETTPPGGPPPVDEGQPTRPPVPGSDREGPIKPREDDRQGARGEGPRPKGFVRRFLRRRR